MYRKLDHGKLASSEKDCFSTINDVLLIINLRRIKQLFLVWIGFILYPYLGHLRKVFVFKYRREENDPKILD